MREGLNGGFDERSELLSVDPLYNYFYSAAVNTEVHIIFISMVSRLDTDCPKTVHTIFEQLQ